MTLNVDQIAECARILDTAAEQATPVPMISLEHPSLTLPEAYTIQRASMARRMTRGQRLVGMKMGLTSEAKMRQVGVHSPIYGHLTDAMQIEDGGALRREACCHPRAEPELCFILGQPLRGQVTPEQAMAAVSHVCAALEIIDSRYKNFKFTLTDVVADNASSRGFVLGAPVAIDQIDVAALPMVMRVDGEVVERGSSEAIYGHPARSLAALACLLDEVGEGLDAGMLVMSGGATAAVAVHPGQRVEVEVEGMGKASFEVVGQQH